MKISNETKVGSFTAIVITMLVLGYNFLKGNDVFSRTNFYYAIYDNVDGLTTSNAVKLNGLKVGQVKEVTIRPDFTLLVRFEIRADLPISKYDTANIVATDLFGTKALVLTNCRQQPLANENDTINGILKPGMMQALGDAMGPVKAKTTELLLVIDSVAKSLKETLGSKGNSDLAASLADIRATIGNLKTMSGSLSSLVGEENSRLNQILGNVASISKNLKDNNEVLSKTMKNMKSITDSLAATDLKNTIAQTRNTLAGLNEVIKKINSGEGSLGLLVNDKKLYDNLQNTAADLDKLVIDLKANPKRYVHISVFGGKEKKSKK